MTAATRHVKHHLPLGVSQTQYSCPVSHAGCIKCFQGLGHFYPRQRKDLASEAQHSTDGSIFEVVGT